MEMWAWIIGSSVAWLGMGIAAYRINPEKGYSNYTNADRVFWLPICVLFAPIALMCLALGRLNQSGYYDRPAKW